MNKNNSYKNFTASFLVFLSDFAGEVLTQPITLNQAYWEAVQLEKNKKEKRRKEKQKYYSTINSLVRLGYLLKENKNNEIVIKLTPKGILKTKKIIWNKNKIKKSTLNKCIVIFDIPEKEKRIRNLFRSCLYELGFEKLQRSVFICKSDASKEIKSIIKSVGIEEYVEIIVGRKI